MTSIVGLLWTLIRSIIVLMLNILLLPVSVLNTLIAVIFHVEAEIVSIIVTVLYFSRTSAATHFRILEIFCKNLRDERIP